MRTVRLLLLLTALSSSLAAQQLPPALFVTEPDRPARPLGLTRLEVDVRIFGHLAETRTTMTFANPGSRPLAGDLYFPLPEGSTISGYALDVEGRMVDGVVVEKAQGRQVFEKIVRQGIDPGLVEWVKGNNFKTRLFPIPAHGSRTVRVAYISELTHTSGGTLYHLPLDYPQPIAQFSLRIEVVKETLSPEIRSGSLANFSFARWRDSYVAETEMTDATLDEDLLIALPEVERRRVIVEKDPEGNHHFALFDFPPTPRSSAPPTPGRITLLWDASGSRGSASHERELKLLESYLARFSDRSVEIDLILFRNAADPPVRFTVDGGDASDLLAALRAVPYDGGTQVGAISPPAADQPPDFYLLFTDGLSNYGEEEPTGFTRPVYILSAAAQTNHPFLRRLATQTGGEYFNLQRLEDREVLTSIGRESFSFIGVEADGIVEDLYPQHRQPVHGRFSLTGRLAGERAQITLLYGVGRKVTHREKIRVARADAVEGDLIRRYWAQRQVDALSAFPRRNREELVALGRRYGLVTPGTSLIVLESLDQYLEHRIPPPSTLPEMRGEYERIVARQDREEKEKKEERIQYVLSLWQQRVEWWETDFEYPENFRYRGDDEKDGERLMEADGAGGDEEEGLLSRMTSFLGAAGNRGEGSMAADSREERAMAPMRTAAVEEELAAPEPAPQALKKAADEEDSSAPAIAIAPWDPDTPYLQALKEADPEDRFAAYMEQRRQQGDAPAFFLDCADFFFRQKQDDLALQILTNVAELELENAALLRVLAHRLAQLDRLDPSIRLFEEALALRPEEPQSHRDLALVLARRAALSPQTAKADYARAIDLLYHVVLQPWDRFSEIETIALMELNRLIPLARAAGVETIPVDPRLVKLLDLDIRILLTWDADMTDMDLWVVEPSGEKAFYSHPRTTIGGHMSRDFTDGYGPEEYCLKKAQHGEYRIQANYYGSSAPTLIGAVTLQAEVVTNFGRPDEQRQALTVRLTGAKETVDIGVIEF